jgi:hypothetical protein
MERATASVPPRGLPGNANLEQLGKGATALQRAVRAGDTGAAEVVREFHPRLAGARPGSSELAGFTRADAQLVVAPIGGPITDERELADEFLRLACLNYGNDDPARRRHATELLEVHRGLVSAGIYTAAVASDVSATGAFLAADPSLANREGGPFDC